MYQVTIYIETSIKGPSKRKAAGMYVLEFIRENGVPETRNGIIYMETVNENGLVLELILEAFKRLTKSCSVLVNTECQHVFNVIGNHWLPAWEKNGWKNAKGKTNGNMVLWQQLKDYMDRHVVTLTQEEHSYKEIYMKSMIRKELEKEHTESVERRKDV